MTGAEMSQAVLSVGFPTACCIILWRYVTTTMKEITDTMVKNTRVLDSILERLQRLEELELKELEREGKRRGKSGSNAGD